MSFGIYFVPEGYSTAGQRLMGRNAAGESFLRAYLAYSPTSELWVQVEKIEDARAFLATARKNGRQEPVVAVDRNSLNQLQNIGGLYLPGPGVGEHAWYRSYYGHASWSLCGVTHTTASARAMDALVELITAPVQEWDAVICTSHAVKKNVEKVLAAQHEYMNERFGVCSTVLPMLPVIPLGVHVKDFSFTEQQRQLARKSLGVEENAIVVLFAGRLSFHAKAHPLAMYQALECAARGVSKHQKIVLVECGWHANDAIASAYAEAAKMACPSVRVEFLDGRDSKAREIGWAGADIFCSLSDNVQETFGLTPVEAMASGLPVVVSDWDGYKDTVRDGVDGFRIRTLAPEASLGDEFARRYALGLDNYDMYCGYTSSMVSVDIDATTQAFLKLFGSKELRKKMGDAGRARAYQEYDWSIIFQKYEELWGVQQQIRLKADKQSSVLKSEWPARLSPFNAFSDYPTENISKESLIKLGTLDLDEALLRMGQYRALKMVNFVDGILASPQECEKILGLIDGASASISALLSSFKKDRQITVSRTICWLAKLGVVVVWNEK